MSLADCTQEIISLLKRREVLDAGAWPPRMAERTPKSEYEEIRNMRNLVRCFLALFFACSIEAFAANTLPERLVLEYTLTHGRMEAGEVTRKLYRQSSGNYVHTMWTRPTGFAKLLASAEWHEEGEFAVQRQEVRPLRFSEKRSGDKRAYDYRVTFNWQKSQLVFNTREPRPLPKNIQDQSSVLYALMLNPMNQPGERLLPVTNGKDVDTYKFIYAGRETLQTPFGKSETIIVRRVAPKQLDEEQQCRAQSKKPSDCPPDDFTYWLAPEKNFVAVKMQKRRKDETSTMVLRQMKGL